MYIYSYFCTYSWPIQKSNVSIQRSIPFYINVFKSISRSISLLLCIDISRLNYIYIYILLFKCTCQARRIMCEARFPYSTRILLEFHHTYSTYKLEIRSERETEIIDWFKFFGRFVVENVDEEEVLSV